MRSDISLSTGPDNEIIENLKHTGSNKRIAEEQLFRKYLYFIHEGINKYSLSEDDVFDAYSDTILAAIDIISRNIFENRSSLKTYLYRIFNNKCVDLLRKRTTNKSSVYRTSSIDDMLSQLSDTAKTILQQMIERTDRDEIKKRLNEIGETCRRILMQFSDGCSDKEIAIEMDYKSADVVKTTRLRCLEKLRLLYKSR